MTFKMYDLLSQVIPGFLIYFGYIMLNGDRFNPDMAIPVTVFAFVIGYLVNTVSSWLEPIYFSTWGGKPSINLMHGNDLSNIRFYETKRLNTWLKEDAQSEKVSKEELYAIAMRKANSDVDSRVHDFNASYAFSRVILTTFILLAIMTVFQFYKEWIIYPVILLLLFIAWLRAKQRAYYHAREVLNTYLKLKETEIKSKLQK